jgi:hypothetical protein
MLDDLQAVDCNMIETYDVEDNLEQQEQCFSCKTFKTGRMVKCYYCSMSIHHSCAGYSESEDLSYISCLNCANTLPPERDIRLKIQKRKIYQELERDTEAIRQTKCELFFFRLFMHVRFVVRV